MDARTCRSRPMCSNSAAERQKERRITRILSIFKRYALSCKNGACTRKTLIRSIARRSKMPGRASSGFTGASFRHGEYGADPLVKRCAGERRDPFEKQGRYIPLSSTREDQLLHF